jgi:hypothetical protein
MPLLDRVNKAIRDTEITSSEQILEMIEAEIADPHALAPYGKDETGRDIGLTGRLFTCCTDRLSRVQWIHPSAARPPRRGPRHWRGYSAVLAANLALARREG